MSGRRESRDTVSFVYETSKTRRFVWLGPQPSDERIAYLSDQAKNVDHLIVVVLLMKRARS